MSQPFGPPGPPKEEPAIPLEPEVASARSAYIKSNIEKINVLKHLGKSKEDIRNELGRFAEDYPALFKMVMQGDSKNEGSLRTMIAMLEKMGSGELTQHQASVIVGQRLHDIYIKPKMGDMERKE